MKKISLLILMVVAAMAVALTAGAVLPTREILLKLRLPRVLLAFVVGGALSVSGLLCQVTLQNSLADPYLLGISSGAMVGAILSLGFLHAGPQATMLLAFVGGLVGLVLTLVASGRRRWMDPPTLVLSGAVVSFFLSAISLLALTLIQAPDLPGILFWVAGDCSLATYSSLRNVALAAIFPLGVAFWYANDLEILETGEEEARSLGVHTKRIICASLLASTFAAAVCVATVGMIGFIGLMIPHGARGLFGHRLRLGTVGAFFLGGGTLIVADLFARSFFAVGELPVGSLTALVGCPFLLWLLRKGSLT